MSHSMKDPGLQEHSIGEEYPWTIAMVQTAKDSYWQPIHTLTVEKGPRYPVSFTYGSKTAYKTAEEWITNRKRFDNPAEWNADFVEPLADKLEKELSLVEFSFMIPVVNDKTRQEHSPQLWQWLADELVDLADGFSIHGTIVGCWTDTSGNKVEDTSRLYRVAIPAIREPILRAIVDQCKSVFRQDCIWFAKTSDCVELV